MKNRIITILAESSNKTVDMSAIIWNMFESIEQLEDFGFVKVNRSFSGSKVDSLEITKLGREFYKEKILKKKCLPKN